MVGTPRRTNRVKRDCSMLEYFWKAMFLITGGNWWWSPIMIQRFSLLYPSSGFCKERTALISKKNVGLFYLSRFFREKKHTLIWPFLSTMVIKLLWQFLNKFLVIYWFSCLNCELKGYRIKEKEEVLLWGITARRFCLYLTRDKREKDLARFVNGAQWTGL